MQHSRSAVPASQQDLTSLEDSTYRRRLSSGSGLPPCGEGIPVEIDSQGHPIRRNPPATPQARRRTQLDASLLFPDPPPPRGATADPSLVENVVEFLQLRSRALNVIAGFERPQPPASTRLAASNPRDFTVGLPRLPPAHDLATRSVSCAVACRQLDASRNRVHVGDPPDRPSMSPLVPSYGTVLPTVRTSQPQHAARRRRKVERRRCSDIPPDLMSSTILRRRGPISSSSMRSSTNCVTANTLFPYTARATTTSLQSTRSTARVPIGFGAARRRPSSNAPRTSSNAQCDEASSPARLGRRERCSRSADFCSPQRRSM